MAFIVIFIVVLIVACLISMANDSARKAENEGFENSMKDINVSEKYHSENWKVGMLYDKTNEKARILHYKNKQYEDIDVVELGFASAFFGSIVFSNKKENCVIFASCPIEKDKDSEVKISKIGDFQADKFIRNKNSGNGYGIVKMGLEPCVVIDSNNKKILFINDIENPSEKRIALFNDIISVEIVENGTTIFSKSTTRTIGGALVGNALMGGAGAVVGGLSGNSKKSDKVDSVSVKILVRDVENPTIILNLHKGRELETSNEEYKKLNEFANEIKDVISVIIDSVDNENKSTESKCKQPDANITDELMKIAKLKEDGLLTDEEFSKMKLKLLNSYAKFCFTAQNRGNLKANSRLFHLR